MKKVMFKAKGRKKMLSQENHSACEIPAGWEELTSEETKSIVAGESAAYWLGYIAGKIASIFS
jgi:hypothetical protein